MLRHVMLGAALVATVSMPAAAQIAPGRFELGPRVGYTKYATKTGMRGAAVLGMDALYYLNRHVGIGFLLDAARPSTDSSYFPVEMSFGDTTYIYAAAQPLAVLQYAVQGELTTGGRIAPFISGSVGGYRVTLDPQVSNGEHQFTHVGFSWGGGITIGAGGGASVRLEVRDFVFTNFDRSALNPVSSRFEPSRFPDLVPLPAPFSGTAHNIHVALGFAFSPGGAR